MLPFLVVVDALRLASTEYANRLFNHQQLISGLWPSGLNHKGHKLLLGFWVDRSVLGSADNHSGWLFKCWQRSNFRLRYNHLRLQSNLSKVISGEVDEIANEIDDDSFLRLLNITLLGRMNCLIVTLKS